MEEIEAYIEEKEKKVQTPSLSDDPISFTLKQLEFGEILISLCFHKKAIHYLEQVWNRMLDHLTDKDYKQLLLHAGISYTMALDYIGEFAKCEVVFLKLNDIFQDGVHLGDYAYFLHRRKREFDKAEE